MTQPTDFSRRIFIGTAGAIGLGMLANQARAENDQPLAPPDRQPPDLHVPEAPKKTIGWAIVGLGELALGEILPAFAECKFSRPVALVSGHPDKAKRVAAAHGVPDKNIYNYENYDRLRDNPDVDVIYIVLPNSMHAEYTIRGFQAGKHVLCEKPMSASIEEAEQMIEAGHKAQRKLMIAYRLRYEPFNRKAIELCQQKIGKIQSITAMNCQQVKAPNIRLSKQLAGGPLGDVGIYCLNAARYLTGEEPAEVTAFSQQPSDDPRFREVPSGVTWCMRFPSGAIAHCDCNFNASESRAYRVHGTDAFVELDGAFGYRGQRLRIVTKSESEELQISPANHFAAEMDHFSECVLNDRQPLTAGAEGLADMRIVKSIEKSAQTGKAVQLEGHT